MKNFTFIPNELLEKSNFPIIERYLIALLLRYCGKKDYCYPSQKTLAKVIGCSERYVRKLLERLKDKKIISVSRTGFNRPNTYKVNKDLIRNYSSPINTVLNTDRSSHIGTAVPIYMGNEVPSKSIYIKRKDNNNQKNLEALNNCREELKKKGFPIGIKNKEVMPIR